MISRLRTIYRITISNNTIKGVVGSSDCSGGKHSPDLFAVVVPAQGAALLAVLAHSKEGMCTHIPGKVQERGCSLQGHLSRCQGHRARCGCTCPCRGAGSPHNPSSSAGIVSRHEPQGKVPSGRRAGKAEALPVSSRACSYHWPSTHGWPPSAEAKGGTRLLFFSAMGRNYLNPAFNFLASHKK